MSEDFVKKMLESQVDYLTKKLEVQSKLWLLHTESIDAITDLTDDEIADFSVAEYQDNFMKTRWGINTSISMFIEKNKSLKISRNRLGRGEAESVFKPQEPQKEEEKKGKIQEILGTP